MRRSAPLPEDDDPLGLRGKVRKSRQAADLRAGGVRFRGTQAARPQQRSERRDTDAAGGRAKELPPRDAGDVFEMEFVHRTLPVERVSRPIHVHRM